MGWRPPENYTTVKQKGDTVQHPEYATDQACQGFEELTEVTIITKEAQKSSERDRCIL